MYTSQGNQLGYTLYKHTHITKANIVNKAFHTTIMLKSTQHTRLALSLSNHTHTQTQHMHTYVLQYNFLLYAQRVHHNLVTVNIDYSIL